MSAPSTTSTRLRLSLALTLLPLVPITARLAQLQVYRHDRLKSLADQEVRRTAPEVAPRGRILDRKGRVLTESVPASSLYAEPRRLAQRWSAANALAPLLGMTREAVLAKLDPKTGFVWLARRLPFETARQVSALGITGLGLVPGEDRGYPNGDLARNVLGSVSLEGAGQSGIELAFHKQLDGENRLYTVITDAQGRTVFRRSEKPIKLPTDIRLTLDQTMQYFAEEAAREARQKHRAKKVMIAVQDPKTGELLAMAEDPVSPLRNGLVQDVFEPGSTFKVVGMAGVLEERAASLTERVDCEHGRWEQSPKVFIRDHEPEGLLTIQEIMERSSNIGMAKIVERIGPVKTYLYTRNFGFGLKTGFPLPGESGGIVHPPEKITRVLLGQMAFGQGVSVSALQLVSAFSALANGGDLMEPRIVQGQPPAKVRRVASPATVQRLVAFLEGVVEKGTGVTARIPGIVVAGKTGTAQKADPLTGKYSREHYMSSFCGFAPSRDPKFTICVMVDEPQGEYYGSETAAPVFAKLGRQLLTLEGAPPPAELPPPPKAPARLAPAGPLHAAVSSSRSDLRDSPGPKPPRPAPPPAKPSPKKPAPSPAIRAKPPKAAPKKN